MRRPGQSCRICGVRANRVAYAASGPPGPVRLGTGTGPGPGLERVDGQLDCVMLLSHCAAWQRARIGEGGPASCGRKPIPKTHMAALDASIKRDVIACLFERSCEHFKRKLQLESVLKNEHDRKSDEE
jgi:hypothetical protein